MGHSCSQVYFILPATFRLVYAVFPDLAYHSLEVPASHVNNLLGLGLSASDMAALLSRMQLVATVKTDGETLALQVSEGTCMYRGKGTRPHACSQEG